MFTKALTFLGSITFASLDTMKPRIVPENTMNAHLSRFFFVATLSFLKSTQIVNFPFFGGKTTIRDSQFASLISLIKLMQPITYLCLA